MKTILKNCRYCNIEFYAWEHDHKRGMGHYCCRECQRAHAAEIRKQKTIDDYAANPKICEQCGGPIAFEKRKSGTSFCSRVCYGNSKKGKPLCLSTESREKANKNIGERARERAKETIRNNKIQYYNNPKLCSVCNEPIQYEKRNSQTCSKECYNTLLKITSRSFELTNENFKINGNISNKCGFDPSIHNTPPYFISYMTVNIVNGNFYVGVHKTNNINDTYLGSGNLLRKAIKKHGKDNFKREILFCFDNQDLMKQMEHLIVTKEFCKRRDTYNICEGGGGGFDYINENGFRFKRGRKPTSPKPPKNRNPMSDEHKKKLSESGKQRYENLSCEEKEKIKENMRQAQKLRPTTISDEHKTSISNSMKEVWDSGKRKRINYDLQSMQNQLNDGAMPIDIMKMFNLTKNQWDYIVSSGKVIRNKTQ